MKKRVAFVTRKMVIGGTEKALLPILSRIDPEKYEVDLYLQHLGGELFSEIPKFVHPILIPSYRSLPMSKVMKHPIRVMDYLKNKAMVSQEEPYYRQCERACHCLPMIDKKYDFIISFHAPDALPFFYPVNNMRADKRIMWLHFDIEQTNAVNPLAASYFAKYDQFFAVSEHVKSVFIKHYPNYSDRVNVFYNYVDTLSIKKKALAGETFQDHFEGIRILSLGRMDPQKGYDVLLPALKKMKNDNVSFRFYLCGDGNQRSELEMMRDKLDLNEEVIFLGMKSNPFGYLKDCDLYVQPSRYEGFCTTTNEARVFCKPSVVTDVCGMREQFDDHKSATIVPCTSEALYKGLMELINNPDLCEQYRVALSELALDKGLDVESIFKEG